MLSILKDAAIVSHYLRTARAVWHAKCQYRYGSHLNTLLLIGSCVLLVNTVTIRSRWMCDKFESKYSGVCKRKLWCSSWPKCPTNIATHTQWSSRPLLWIRCIKTTTTSTRQHENSTSTGSEFENGTKSMISYKESVLVLQQKKRKLYSGRTPIFINPDQWLFELFEEERSEVRPVTNASIQYPNWFWSTTQRI